MAQLFCAFGLLCITTVRSQYSNINYYQNQDVSQNDYQNVHNSQRNFDNNYVNYPETSCPYFHYTFNNGQTEGSLSLQSQGSTSTVKMEFMALTRISASFKFIKYKSIKFWDIGLIIGIFCRKINGVFYVIS